MIKNKRRCKTIVHTFVQLASLFPVAKKSEENYITFPSRENISSKLKLHTEKCGLVFTLAKKFIQATLKWYFLFVQLIFVTYFKS